MTDLPAVSSNVLETEKLMRHAVEAMSQYPPDFTPSPEPPPRNRETDIASTMGGLTMSDLLEQPAVKDFVRRSTDSLPRPLLNVFLQAGSFIAQILAAHGVRDVSPMQAAMTDLTILQMIGDIGKIDEAKAARLPGDAGEPSDPFGVKQALRDKILQQSLANQTPLARMLTALLGRDALPWLTGPRRDGPPTIQPHEFTRIGWARLVEIENQLAVEQRLLRFSAEGQSDARMAVALAWTMAALASFMPPALFLGENTTHIVSKRAGGKYSTGFGTASHVLVSFTPASMKAMVDILADGLTNPLLTAADLMSIGMAIARVGSIRVEDRPTAVTTETFDLFLSHRGPDAKKELASAFDGLPSRHGVFLDCMTLPHGVINRNFIFGSLARSRRIVIVDTANYENSEWCRKEAWFAEALARRGLTDLAHATLQEATGIVRSDGPTSSRGQHDPRYSQSIARRVLRDLDYWARSPNLHSLEAAGGPVDLLDPLRELLARDPSDSPSAPLIAGRAVKQTFAAMQARDREAGQTDLWMSGLQLAVAVFASSSTARSKDEVRRGIDQMTEMMRSFVDRRMHLAEHFLADPAAYLSIVAAAVASQLAGFKLDNGIVPAVREATGGKAVIHDGLLLFDMRRASAARSFQLAFAVELVKANIGGVGIIQSAADEVHRGFINQVPIEILPCVTLHEGMSPPGGLSLG